MTCRAVTSRGWLYLLLGLITIASRVAYLIHDPPFKSLWADEIERAAASLVRDGVLGNIWSSTSGPSAFISPLYSTFLAGIYSLLGWNTIAGRIGQEVCAVTASALGIMALPSVATRTNLSPFAGWLAAFTLAVSPLNLWVESSGGREEPYAALMLLWLIFVFSRLRVQQWNSWGLTGLLGLCCGLAVLLNPALLPAAAAMTALEVLADPNRRVVRAFLALLIAACVLTPWTVRNYLVFGKLIPFRSNFGLELAVGNNPAANGRTYITSFDDPHSPFKAMHPFTNKGQRDRLVSIGEVAYMAERQAEAWAWIRAHPGEAVKLTVRRFRLFWFPSQDLWPPSSPGRAFKATIGSLIGLAALANLLWLLTRRHEYAWLLSAAVVGPSLVYMITHVDMRYRYPIYGLSTLLAWDAVLRLAGAIRWNQATRS